MGFRGIREYDISQAEGPEVHRPECMRLDGDIEDFDGIMSRLQDATSAPICFTDESGGDNGWYDRSNHTITVRRTASEKAMLKTAVHEVAHCILHRDGFEPRSREQMEVEAESTAFLVCDHFGLDSGGYSFGYVAGWAESILAERNGEKRLLAIIGDLSDAAWRIIDAVDPPGEGAAATTGRGVRPIPPDVSGTGHPFHDMGASHRLRSRNRAVNIILRLVVIPRTSSAEQG